MKPIPVINANNFAIYPQLVNAAIAKSGLEWAITRAQSVALESLALNSPVTIIHKETGETLRLEMFPAVRTFAGFPLTIDDSLPEGTIEFRLNGEPIVRVENLAIPYGMETAS